MKASVSVILIRRTMSRLRLRTLAHVILLVLPACVAKLGSRNEPEIAGAVTGAPADCSKGPKEGGSAPGGDAAPKFVGRFAAVDPETGEAMPPRFDWSGNSISVRFQGTSSVTVKLALEGVSDQLFEFVVDDLPPSTRLVTVKKDASGQWTNEPQEDYEIAGLDPKVPHEVVIHKNTEAQKGPVTFKGFDLHGGTLLPPTRRARRIEFIGDSIVCGYGNEGKNATCPFEVKVRDARAPDGKTFPITVPLTENQYESFTSRAARVLDADATTICWSGKGVYKNYKERTKERNPQTGAVEDAKDQSSTVPDLWEGRTIGGDYEGYKWDWSNEKPEDVPHVVFVSLGTNDFSRDSEPQTTDPDKLPGDNIPDGLLYQPGELDKFYAAYLELIRKVRLHRPSAHIFIATPPMVTDQFPLEHARSSLRNVLDRIVAEMLRGGDQKVYAMNLVEQGFRYGLGCDYHPNLEVHRIMSEQLVSAIRSKTCW